MINVRRIVNVVLPVQIRTILRGIHRDYIFSLAMKRFLEAPESCLENTAVLSDLVYGWGNNWSVMPEYLEGCVRQALAADGPILECGSGLSTIIIGAIAKKRGNTLWSLEHSPEWGEKVQKYLNKYGIDSVVLCVKPLKAYKEFSWYEPSLELMPDNFSLIVCDGPPGDTRGGRYGLVPIMKKKIKVGCVILIDDAAREQEREIARRWELELGASSEMFGVNKPYIQMVVTNLVG